MATKPDRHGSARFVALKRRNQRTPRVLSMSQARGDMDSTLTPNRHGSADQSCGASSSDAPAGLKRAGVMAASTRKRQRQDKTLTAAY